MVELEFELDRLFQALADPTRRSMLQALRDEDLSVGELAAPFSMSLAGAAKHIQVLERARLIARRKQGRSHYCTINREAVEEAGSWIDQHLRLWNSRLDLLAGELRKEKGETQ